MSVNKSFYQQGYELIPDIIDAKQAKNITDVLDPLFINHSGGGVRNVDKKLKIIRELAHSTQMLSLASNYLNANANANLIRVIAFNKSVKNNWGVSWHQDKTVSLSKKDESLGWAPWSIKDATVHATPPAEIMEQILTIRIHLDDCNLENGCLKLIPCTHNQGILKQNEIERLRKASSKVEVITPKFSALVMKPLLLHASRKALKPKKRRVLHLEYSSYQLPNQLKWA